MYITSKFKLIVIIAVMLILSGCTEPKLTVNDNKLKLLNGKSVTYECENKDQVVAKYYSLSDDSLNFAKITMSNGQQHTLPNAISGSGAKYADEFAVWWTKENTALFEIRDKKGKWTIKYKNCREILK